MTAARPAGIPRLGRPRLGRPLLTVPAALLAGFLALALGLLTAGYDPVLALGALWRGGLGSTDAIVSATLVRAAPLIVLGLGVALAFRAGALNIGAEGQFYAGAIAATWVGLHAAGWPAPLAIGGVLLAALVAGSLWIALPVLLKLRFGVLEVISTLLLNFVAEAAVSWAVTGPLREARGVYPQSDPIALGARLPRLEGTRLHAGFVVPLALAAVLWLLFTRTRWGFRLRAVGLGPRAAAVSGRMPVARVVAGALLWSGALAGLGGGLEIAGVTWALFQNLSPGYGFTAIAVALLARLHPIGIVGTGLLFGALEAGAQGMQREAGVPAVAVAVVEAAIILVVLLAEVAARRAVVWGGPGEGRGPGDGPGNSQHPAPPSDASGRSAPGSGLAARAGELLPPSGHASGSAARPGDVLMPLVPASWSVARPGDFPTPPVPASWLAVSASDFLPLSASASRLAARPSDFFTPLPASRLAARPSHFSTTLAASRSAAGPSHFLSASATASRVAASPLASSFCRMPVGAGAPSMSGTGRYAEDRRISRVAISFSRLWTRAGRLLSCSWTRAVRRHRRALGACRARRFRPGSWHPPPPALTGLVSSAARPGSAT